MNKKLNPDIKTTVKPFRVLLGGEATSDVLLSIFAEETDSTEFN